MCVMQYAYVCVMQSAYAQGEILCGFELDCLFLLGGFNWHC